MKEIKPKTKKHPAMRGNAPTVVGRALRGAAKKVAEALGGGAPNQHPAMRANERGSANIAANRTPRKAAPKQHPAMRDMPKGRKKN
jgi:hypothetical protein